MVSVRFGDDVYNFVNGDWYGASKGGQSDFSRFYPGNNTRAPLCIYPQLLSAGLEQGYDRSVFSRKIEADDESDDFTEETEKPRRKSRAKKKSNSNSISIF